MNNYLDNIDEILEELLLNGYVRLPSIKGFDLDNVASRISEDMQGDTFKELSFNHKNFLETLGISEILSPKLFKLASEKFNYGGKAQDQYHVARRVEPGNSKEFYRGHFDSHLFTLVLPIKIPHKSKDDKPIGELIFFPFARSQPKYEFINFFQKIWFRLFFSSRNGLKNLSKKTPMSIELFDDYRPLLFLGNTFFHTNKPVDKDASSYRLTLLAHFYDPSPKYGIGNILRIFRSR
jgi:hypothetical protein